MSFDSFSEFLAMGGHGFYVWSAYLVAAGVVVFTLILPLWRRRRFVAMQRSRLRRATGRADGGNRAGTVAESDPDS